MMKVHIITLGCPKNQVDSEGMSSILAAQGHTLAASVDDADVVIVNTCSFIAAAREETLTVLHDVTARKTPNQRLVAAGCMAESHRALVAAEPGVDAILGTREWMRIGEVIETLQSVAITAPPDTAPAREIIPLTSAVAPSLSPHDLGAPGAYADWRTAPIRRCARGPSAYLKISDGCNLRCAFCTIPSFKGDMRSKAMGAILGEAQELVAAGVKEIVLVAQHLTDYGRDLGLKDGLAILLDELCAVLPENVWVRLMYAYPHGISARLIATMARHRQICHYLDMPLQHAHPETLRRMRRPPDTERTRRLIDDLRAAMPDIAIRSTFIVGFPGETDTEFRVLLAFLEDVQFDRVGVFRYSREPGTPAAALAGQVTPRIIERRWHEIMRLQQRISRECNRRWIGRVVRVLVEGQGQTDDGRMLSVGRSFRDAPEVDGQVLFWGAMTPGTFVDVRVTQALDYDLWGDVAAVSDDEERIVHRI